MNITRTDGERITRFLDLQTPIPERADLAFVFGTYHPEPAHIAAELLIHGIVPRVTLTGGTNPRTGENEANKHLAILLQSGIPRECIIVEDRSTNTQENVVFALREAANCLDLRDIRSVIVIAKWYHCRRAMMTLKRHMPNGVRYSAATYAVDGITRSEWWQTAAGIQRVEKEQTLIPQYLARGDIAEITAEGEVYI